MTQRKIIHFAHANGFPAKAYKKMLSDLAEEFEVGFTERLGHNPNFPVTDNWTFLKEELRQEIESRYSAPIIGLGHSLGGILHILVAVENPQLYEHIILLDSPLISPLGSRFIRFAKRTGLIKKLSLATVAKRRKNFWNSKEEAVEHFKGREKFRSFDADVISDFVENCIVKNEEGFKLLFDPRIEAQIYRTIPDIIPVIYHKIKVPFSFIAGSRSNEVKLAGIYYTKRHPMMKHFVTIEGSHLFPLEKPKETAQVIKEIIKKCHFD